MAGLMTDKTVLDALNDFMEHLRNTGAAQRAEKIRAALKEGMYPPKYIYLLVREGQL